AGRLLEEPLAVAQTGVGEALPGVSDRPLAGEHAGQVALQLEQPFALLDPPRGSVWPPRVFRPQLLTAAKGLQGFAHLPAVLQRLAEVGVGLGIIRLYLDGLAVRSDRFPELALESKGAAEVVMGPGIFGVEGNGLFVGGHGQV